MRCLVAGLGTRGDVEPFDLLAAELAARGHRVALALDAGHHEGARSVPGVDRVALGGMSAADLKALVSRVVAARTPLERSQAAHAGFLGHRQGELGERIAALARGGVDVAVVSEDLLFDAARPPWPAPTVVVAYTPARVGHFLHRARPACLNLAALSATIYAGARRELFAAWTFTGWWIRRAGHGLQPAVEDFLARGQPPFFLTMGSMLGFDAPALAAAFVAAAREAGGRAMVQRGWSGLDTPAADDLLVVDEIEYAALFPRCAALFVHGGTGTVAHALCAGRPLAILPIVNDQWGWARVLDRLGNGLGALDPFAPSRAGFAAAMRAARDRGVQQSATALGARVAMDDGLATACAAIERYVGS